MPSLKRVAVFLSLIILKSHLALRASKRPCQLDKRILDQKSIMIHTWFKNLEPKLRTSVPLPTMKMRKLLIILHSSLIMLVMLSMLLASNVMLWIELKMVPKAKEILISLNLPEDMLKQFKKSLLTYKLLLIRLNLMMKFKLFY